MEDIEISPMQFLLYPEQYEFSKKERLQILFIHYTLKLRVATYRKSVRLYQRSLYRVIKKLSET